MPLAVSAPQCEEEEGEVIKKRTYFYLQNKQLRPSKVKDVLKNKVVISCSALLALMLKYVFYSYLVDHCRYVVRYVYYSHISVEHWAKCSKAAPSTAGS